MNRRPNAPKCILGVVMVVLLVVGGWATTTARLSTPKTAATQPRSMSPRAAGDDLLSSVFELDGDITDFPAGPPDDWTTVNCGGGPTVKSFAHDGLGLSIFTGGGSKDPELLGSWKWKDGSVPDKDEIINAYAAKYTGTPNGDEILIFGADRFDNSGSAFIGFWFFKGSVFAAADGKFRQGPLATDALAVHQVGDLLILIEFSNGGVIPTSRVLEWVGTGGSESGGTLNDITATAPSGAIQSISNGQPQTIPGGCPAWQYTPKGGVPGGPISINSFFEGGINLTAFPALAGACFSSFAVETRSSPSTTATLKDFALGQFEQCGLDCGKISSASSVCEGDSVTYTYSAHNPGSIPTTVSLVDDNATPLDCSDDIDVLTGLTIGCAAPSTIILQPDNGAPGGTDEVTKTRTVTLAVGSYHNTLTVHASNPSGIPNCVSSADVTVFPKPTANAGNPQTVNCTDAATTAFTLAGTSTNGTGVWSVVSGPVVINSQSQNGNAVGASVTFTGTGTATLRLTTTGAQGNTCPPATSDIVLTVTPNVHVSINSASCNTNASTVTLTATPSGGTPTIGFQWSGGSSSTSNSITVGPGTYTVTVTDANGCTATATRKVGVCTD